MIPIDIIVIITIVIVIVIIIIIIITTIIFFDFLGIFRPIRESTNEINSVDIDWPPHQFMTQEKAGLVVHYMSHDNHPMIESSSGLKVWHFNSFNRLNPKSRTMLFFMRDDDIENYYWLTNLCRQVHINLALIYVIPSLIHELKPNKIWSKDQLILATDGDKSKLYQFINLDPPLTVRTYSGVMDEEYPKSDRYLAIIIFSHDRPSNIPITNVKKTVFITDIDDINEHNHHDIIVYKTDWSRWPKNSVIDLSGSVRPDSMDYILQQLVKLLSDN